MGIKVNFFIVLSFLVVTSCQKKQPIVLKPVPLETKKKETTAIEKVKVIDSIPEKIKSDSTVSKMEKKDSVVQVTTKVTTPLGIYKGKVMGMNVQLKLDSFDFELQETKYQTYTATGKWYKIGDGSKIELESAQGNTTLKYFAFTEEGALQILDNKAQFIDNVSDDFFLYKE